MELAERYKRNNFTKAEQEKLAESKVLLIGLGGLGGHIFDCLLRIGVGHITAIDGDIFESSNLNRQLLSEEENIGKSKALVASAYGKKIQKNAQVHVLDKFVEGHDFLQYMEDKNIVIDALGGLKDRKALHECAKKACIPLVSAGIAGQTGWVCTLMPEDSSPISFFGEQGVEESIGNLPYTVMVAAGLQCSEVIKVLLSKPAMKGMLFFDLNEPYFLQTRF